MYSEWLRAGRLRGHNSSPSRVKNFFFSKPFRPVLAPTQPPIEWVTGALSPGIKRKGREADHSPPTTADVKKNEFIYPLPHTSSWRSAQLVKHRDNFTLFVPYLYY
jgi:hypothetical protein